MKIGTIVMLIFILALFVVTCMLVAKNVQMANEKHAKNDSTSASAAESKQQ